MKAREIFCLGLGVAVYAGDRLRKKLEPLSPCTPERRQELKTFCRDVRDRRLTLCRDTAKRVRECLRDCLSQGLRIARDDAKALGNLISKD